MDRHSGVWMIVFGIILGIVAFANISLQFAPGFSPMMGLIAGLLIGGGIIDIFA